jgi:GT2 family glycosyltransferase
MVGIVIVSYRSDDLTVRFVREDLSRISVPYQVVVVDNGETGSSALQEKLPEVTVLVSENRGYASACNLGAEWLRDQVHPESVLFCNNDLRFLSDRVVETLCETLSAHPDVGAIGPCIVGPDGRRQSPEPYRGLWNRYVWMYVLTPFLSRDRKTRKFQLDYAEKASEGYHYKLMGSFLMVRAEAFFEAGCFDEGTFLYAEEPILSERLSRIGKRCWFCPSVTVLHDHGAVIGSSFKRQETDWMQFRSMAYYYRRYRGYPAWEIALVRMVYRLIQVVR